MASNKKKQNVLIVLKNVLTLLVYVFFYIQETKCGKATHFYGRRFLCIVLVYCLG